MATTTIVAVAIDEKTGSCATYRPAIDTITAKPETTTECPEVAAAISIASTVPCPRRRSSRSRFR